MQNNSQGLDQKGELVKITNLTKKYQNKAALSNINLALEAGHIIGLLGPNGSGKTTLIKILTGVIKDYEGAVSINGND
ncbi:MAG: ATP-binding cassette domain-containing protein, partial [Bacillota bacterium]